MNSKHPLTQEQYDKILVELEELQNILIPANSEALKVATEQGDLSENAEYDDAKEQQAKLHHRLNELKNKKMNAVIIKKSENTDFVEVGHKVTVERHIDGSILSLTLLGQWDGTSESTSIESPLGNGLLGKKKNDTFVIDAPAGELTYKVLSIE